MQLKSFRQCFRQHHSFAATLQLLGVASTLPPGLWPFHEVLQDSDVQVRLDNGLDQATRAAGPLAAHRPCAAAVLAQHRAFASLAQPVDDAAWPEERLSREASSPAGRQQEHHPSRHAQVQQWSTGASVQPQQHLPWGKQQPERLRYTQPSGGTSPSAAATHNGNDQAAREQQFQERAEQQAAQRARAARHNRPAPTFWQVAGGRAAGTMRSASRHEGEEAMFVHQLVEAAWEIGRELDREPRRATDIQVAFAEKIQLALHPPVSLKVLQAALYASSRVVQKARRGHPCWQPLIDSLGPAVVSHATERPLGHMRAQHCASFLCSFRLLAAGGIRPHWDALVATVQHARATLHEADIHVCSQYLKGMRHPRLHPPVLQLLARRVTKGPDAVRLAQEAASHILRDRLPGEWQEGRLMDKMLVVEMVQCLASLTSQQRGPDGDLLGQRLLQLLPACLPGVPPLSLAHAVWSIAKLRGLTSPEETTHNLDIACQVFLEFEKERPLGFLAANIMLFGLAKCMHSPCDGRAVEALLRNCGQGLSASPQPVLSDVSVVQLLQSLATFTQLHGVMSDTAVMLLEDLCNSIMVRGIRFRPGHRHRVMSFLRDLRADPCGGAFAAYMYSKAGQAGA